MTLMERCRLYDAGDELVLTRSFDRADFEQNCAALRRALGDGMMRNERGAAVARRSFSIPVEEANMLLAQNDADFVEWWNTDSTPALARLIVRFPHWVCCEGGGVL